MPAASSDILRKIIDDMDKMRKLIGHTGFSVPPSASSPPKTLPKLILDFPSDILLSIDSLAIPDAVRQDMKTLVTEKVHQFQQLLLSAYTQTCRDLPYTQRTDYVLEKICSLHKQVYEEQHIAIIRAEISKLQLWTRARRPSSNYNDNEGKKVPFNFDYVPFLEKYFEQNAYPSNQDRQALALKSNMSPRQIEVWFQNHRNRAKKEGRVLNRLAPNSNFDLLNAFQPHSDTTKHLRVSHDVVSDSDDDSLDHDDVDQSTPSVLLSGHRPPHAFPARFRAAGIPDPFPNTGGVYKFPVPQWTRRPATRQIPSTKIDMDSFILMFGSKLVLRGGAQKLSDRSDKRIKNKAWHSSTTVIPCPAPHPALLRTASTALYSLRSIRKSSKSYEWKPAPVVCTSAYLPARLPSWKLPFDNRRKARKEAHLPTRMPSAICSRGTASSISSSSRISSVSSVTSNDFSVSDESSPEPTTPLLLPQDVAQDALNTIFDEDLDLFDHMFQMDQYSNFSYTPSQDMLSMTPSDKNNSIPYDMTSSFSSIH